MEIDLKIGTLDIETYKDVKNNSIVYAIGTKVVNTNSSFYVTDFENEDDMILQCINGLMVKKNHNYCIYSHNLSGFDGLFLIKSLMKTSNKHDYKVEPIARNDGRWISITITKKLVKNKIIKITLIDSFLILPFALAKLAQLFLKGMDDRFGTFSTVGKDNDISYHKGIFPYKFMSKDTLTYEGPVPAYEFFDKNKCSLEDYLEYTNLITFFFRDFGLNSNTTWR